MLARSALALPLLLALLGPGSASAQVPPAGSAASPPAAVDEAVRLYGEGLEAIKSGRPADALPKLEASQRLLASANTSLLIAHAHRELGHDVEAMERYDEVIVEVSGRDADAAKPYEAAGADARKWREQLRPRVVQVVVQTDPGASVEIGGRPIRSGETRDGRAVHRGWAAPGAITIRAARDGQNIDRTETGLAGGTVELVLELPKGQGAPVTAPPPTDGGGASAPPVATYVAGGVGLVGLGLFAGFGIASSSAASDLEACDGSCPESLRETQSSGERNQTIANVGLGVGIVGVASAALFWILWPEDQSGSSSAPAGPRLRARGASASGGWTW